MRDPRSKQDRAAELRTRRPWQARFAAVQARCGWGGSASCIEPHARFRIPAAVKYCKGRELADRADFVAKRFCACGYVILIQQTELFRTINSHGRPIRFESFRAGVGTDFCNKIGHNRSFWKRRNPASLPSEAGPQQTLTAGRDAALPLRWMPGF